MGILTKNKNYQIISHMYTKSLTVMAVLTASIARADLFVQEQMNENV